MAEIERLRGRLLDIDGGILELVRDRLEVVADLGRIKRDSGKAIRDLDREATVLEHARDNAERLGLPRSIANAIIEPLIRSALEQQEQDRVAAAHGGDGDEALVIGGRGKLGGWFARFLAQHGFAVRIADPAVTANGVDERADWRDFDLQQMAIIVIATPIPATAAILDELAVSPPERPLIFDVSSLKTPVRDALARLAAAGARVTSVHPMFGPDTRLLAGRHVLFCDVGHADALAQAKALFESTLADLVELTLDDHDRTIAFVLGLSHALNLTFLSALAASGEEAVELARVSSTTFRAQLDVASRVSSENPELYYEIQRLNAHGHVALDKLVTAATEIRDAVADGDHDRFVDIMTRGYRFTLAQ